MLKAQENSKAFLRSSRTDWSYSSIVLSSVDAKALSESYFLFAEAEAEAGETDEYSFRSEGSWVLFPTLPWTSNKT